MFYLDTQRTTTRRESSLITTGRRTADDRPDIDAPLTGRGASTARLQAESVSSMTIRPYGSVRKEIITCLFESMLDHIVDSWDVIQKPATEESYSQVVKATSEVTVKRKKKEISSKPSKIRAKSRSKMDLIDAQSDPMTISWWNQPDEKAVIRFKNGNVYEGSISMKCMNGEGRFQWADGTTYLGHFRDNEIVGKGTITWKDDSWYSGEFLGNLRHGEGLYVDSRLQRHYTGQWHCATKHGKGAISYSGHSKNSYEGDWVYNVPHGFGIREYCPNSVYEGEWDLSVREGQGTMVWPNHDCYKGEWHNGVMSGYGLYIWNTCFNNTMSLAAVNAYRGCWSNGKRTGFGLLDLGLGLGSHYKGEFKENKKHGMGKFVTNNGLILKHKRLFIEDSIKPKVLQESCDKLELCSTKRVIHDHKDPLEFNFCDSTEGLHSHIEEALKNLDKQAEVRALIINTYIENNRLYDSDLVNITCDAVDKISDGISEDMIEFEKDALHKALRSYEKELKNIYHQYATICNTEKIFFNPVLIRLYMWQFYYDCDMHEKGLTLVDIDQMFAQNRSWLSKTTHGPFETIYLWQFINSLVSVACRLHAKRCMPGPRPDTVVAIAFRYFMDSDVLPNVGRCKGYLPQSFGSFVPLRAMYNLYLNLGEPHTVRDFLCAVNRCPHLYMDLPQPDLVEAPEQLLPVGCNAYVVGDEITFIRDPGKFARPEQPKLKDYEKREDLQLFNFGNLSSKTVLKIVANIFPALYDNESIMDLDIKMNFFEFFQACMACSEKSIRVKEEELGWRELFDPSINSANVPAASTPARTVPSTAPAGLRAVPINQKVK